MGTIYDVPSVASIAKLNDVPGPQDVKLGKYVANAIGERFSRDTFDSHPIVMSKGVTGAVPTGTAGDENLLHGKEKFEYHILGTQTIVAPAWDANGLEVGMDQTANDGIELSQGITASSKAAFTVGTDSFYGRCKIKVTDVSGTDDCAFGFRKVEANQATIDGYDEMAVVNVISGAINIETILNNGTTTTTDTTDVLADTETLDIIIKVTQGGSVTYSFDINGAGDLAPTTTAAFAFDSGEVVMPFFYYLHDTDICETLYIQHWENGLLNSNEG